MDRKETNGTIELDFKDEEKEVQEEIKEILERYNPAHPGTIARIMDAVRCYRIKIEMAWSVEYSNRTLKDAQTSTSMTLASVMAGIQVAETTNVFKLIVGSYEEQTYYLVRGAKDEEDARSQIRRWHDENYGPDERWEWDISVAIIEKLEIKEGVTPL